MMFSISLKYFTAVVLIAQQAGNGKESCWQTVSANAAVILTLLTLFVLIWQTCETRRAVNIARSTLVSTFRPRLILRRVSLRPGTAIPTLGSPDPHKWEVDYAIANTGGAKGDITVRSFIVKMFNADGLPVPLPYAPPVEESPFTLGPGEEKQFSVELEKELIFLFRQLGVKRGNLRYQDTKYVYFLGYIHYKDELGIVRKMAVLRHYNTESGRFQVENDPDYEYSD